MRRLDSITDNGSEQTQGDSRTQEGWHAAAAVLRSPRVGHDLGTEQQRCKLVYNMKNKI